MLRVTLNFALPQIWSNLSNRVCFGCLHHHPDLLSFIFIVVLFCCHPMHFSASIFHHSLFHAKQSVGFILSDLMGYRSKHIFNKFLNL